MITIETLLSGIIKMPTVTLALGQALTRDLVTANPYYRQIANFVVAFYSERRVLPKSGDWQIWLDGLSEGMRPGVSEALGRIMRTNLDMYTPEFLADQSIEELRSIAARNAAARLSAAPNITPDLLRELAEDVSSITPVRLEGLAALADVEYWAADEISEDPIPTGLPELDRLIDGWRQEMVFVFADSGVGKSIILSNFGVAAARAGARVLHVTLELYTRPTLHRYYRLITEMNRNAFRSEKQVVIDKTKQFLRYAQGSIHVIYQPAHSLSPSELRGLVGRFADMNDGVDMVIIDYMDLMSADPEDRRMSTYEQLGRNTHKCRAIGGEFEAVTLSASQAVRRAAGAQRLRTSDMGDSYEKVRGADIVLGLVQTDEEAEYFQGRLQGLKFRDAPGRGIEIPLFIYRDYMLMASLDHPNSQRIIRELGLVTAIPVEEDEEGDDT